MRIWRQEVSGGSLAGVDADILMKVTSKPANDPACEGVLAASAAVYVEAVSKRPIFGVMFFCNVNSADFENDLTTSIHEVLHALVRA
jgi:hypothetical protein